MTEEYFVRDSHAPDGFRAQCKHCRAIARQTEEDERRLLLANSLNESVIRMALGEGVPTTNEIPHYTEIYSVISDMLGGARGIAAHWVGQYVAAKDGSPTKSKMLYDLMQMAYKAADDDLNKMPDEYKTQEEIVEELRKIRYEVEPAIGESTDG